MIDQCQQSKVFKNYEKANKNQVFIGQLCKSKFVTQATKLLQDHTLDEQVQDFARPLLRNMVRNGQRVGVRFTVQLVPPRSQAPRPLHLPAGLECHHLLFPFPVVPPALLLRPAHQHLPRVQHERGVRR